MNVAEQIVEALLADDAWVPYSSLTPEQRAAVDEWMLQGIDPQDLHDWVQNFQYRTEFIAPERVKKALEKWGWNWQKPSRPDESEKRISRIKKLRSSGKGAWPYVVGGAEALTFEAWAEDDMNHGDGWHRMMLALRSGEPVEFLFIRKRPGTQALCYKE